MAAVFLSLVLYYFFVDLPAEQKKKTDKERAEKILPLESVVEFSLIGNGDAIALKRNASQSWELTRPLSAPGDSNEAEAFISEINNLKKTRMVEENPKDLSLYGLSSPFLKIHFKSENGEEETLSVGNESPMGGNLYFKRENHSAVMMAPATRSLFEKSVYDFRNKMLLNFSSGDIKRVQVIREKDSLEFKSNGEKWRVSGDIEAQGDKSSIMKFLQSIQLSRVREFINETPDSLKPYGLNPPRLKLILENDSGTAHTLTVGNAKGDKGYFGKINDSANIILVEPALFDTLSKKTVEFLNKTLIEVEDNEVLEMSLQTGDKTIQVTREKNDEWNLQSPIKTAADLATINSLLFDLKEAKITEFIKISLDIPEAFGLDSPQKSFSLKMKNGKTWTLHLGNQTGDGQQVFANRTGEPTVFSISQKVVNKLFRSLHDLRNKKLLKFTSEEAVKISIQTPKKLFELSKTGSQWNLEKPEKVRTEHIGNDLIWALRGLEFSSIITPSLPENLSGLDTPTFTISLWNKSNEKIAALTVGKFFNSEQEYLVQAGNQQYRVKNKFLDAIPRDLAKFKLP